MKKYIVIATFALAVLFISNSCNDYLDVVPDNVATIDNAFALRSEAEKFLFTCYSYMPKDADFNLNPAINGGDEIWRPNEHGGEMFNIARGFQNVVNPYGGFYWSHLYQGIRDCNIFLENIDRVPDVLETEKRQWIAEVKFLKAYYHFYLVRMYGPVPLIKSNLPIDADVNQVKVFRDPVDSCFSYITRLIDEADENLKQTITDPSMLGRITQPIALSLKAKVLVTAASPLFNGNTDESGLVNPDGTPLFSNFSKEKWDLAAKACKHAIDVCVQEGINLYEFQPGIQESSLSDTIITQLSVRNSITEKWNSEIIWANTQSMADYIQILAQPHLDPLYLGNTVIRGNLSPPLRIAEMYYSGNGVPISEDKTWDYSERYSLRTATADEKLYIHENYTTASLNFDREPRYYAHLGFDGGIWYGQGKYDESGLFYMQAKRGQYQGKSSPLFGSVTGYWPKKLVHYQNVISDIKQYSITSYPWPIMRLAGLYLLYAEALNESEGPGPEVYKYVNLVRDRAGLESVESSWSNYSVNPSKYTTQNGMRDIIHQERLIELAFEGQRFWDLRRWMEAAEKLNKPIKGWDLKQESETGYYRPSTISSPTFGTKDYLWPIATSEITRNRNLVQNPGW